MKVKSITLHNIGQFKELTIPLAPLSEGKPKVTVFIGNNGSGKTTVLKSLVTVLSWLPARVRRERGNGSPIPENVIHNDANSGQVIVNLVAHEKEYTWKIHKYKQGKKSEFTTDLKGVSEFADFYRIDLTENKQVNLPILAFYPVERSVLDIPLKIREKHQFEQLNGYDNSLEIGVDFRRFFEWFREREDIENEEISNRELEQYLSEIDEMASDLDKMWNILEEVKFLENSIEETNKKFVVASENDNKQEMSTFSVELVKLVNEFQIKQQAMNLLIEKKYPKKYLKYLDTQLSVVKKAIQSFTNFEDVRVQRKPKLRMVVKKNDLEFEVAQLSQGEKSLMALVGDIARRLVMLNPNLENPLEGQGVVIIDEADLHLHPQWQRQLIMRLTKTFPNCQFILSTHSPLVISDSKDIVVYSLENGEMRQLPSQYGQDANTVLLNVMDTAIRNEWITEQLNKLIDLIQDNQLNLAKEKLAKLKQELPENHLELYKVQILLKKQEIRNEKNSQNK